MEELLIIARLNQVFSQASNAADFCRRLTHDDVLGDGVVGTQILALSNKGTLHVVGGYGLEPIEADQTPSMFEDGPFALSLGGKRSWWGDHPSLKDYVFWILPFIKGDVPVGALASLTKKSVPIEPWGDLAVTAAANTGALYLESLGVKNLFQDRSNGNGGDGHLTDRQYEILIGMAKGQTNAAIAQQLILSESSIKQESVRIFRALGVGTRQQAVAKAKATGLLPDGVFAEEFV